MKSSRILLTAALAILTVSNAISQEQEAKAYRIREPQRKETGLTGDFEETTDRFRAKWLEESGRQHLAKALFDSIPYRPYIRGCLAKRKMPLFLQYLPIVESDYSPTAVSSSGATGIWQFMENSMHPFMKKNEWYDERRDPWKETDAALSKLTDNHRMFGDWALALAAYNMGAGALKRIMKEHPDMDYRQLSKEGILPLQTAEYVSKLAAIADIVENAAYYGTIEIGVQDKSISGIKPEKFGYVKVKGRIELERLAEILDIPLETMEFLNPALLKGCTPPKESYRLRLPEGYASKTAAERLMDSQRNYGNPQSLKNAEIPQGNNTEAIQQKSPVNGQ